jgi:hypothetical protein
MKVCRQLPRPQVVPLTYLLTLVWKIHSIATYSRVGAVLPGLQIPQENHILMHGKSPSLRSSNPSFGGSPR